MLKLKHIYVAFLVGYLMSLVGCSSKPVYEKMNMTYIVQMDMRRPEVAVEKNTDESALEEENTNLLEGLINKELRKQLAQ